MTRHEIEPPGMVAPATDNPAADNGERDDPISLWQRVVRRETIVSFVFSFAILIFFFTRIDFNVQATLDRMRTAQPLWLVLAFVAYYCSFPVRAVRWRMLLANAGLRQERNPLVPGVGGLTEMIYLSWFVNCIVPAKLGDAYRSYLLKNRAGVSFSTTIGTILTERLTDVLVLFGVMALAGLVAFHGHMPPELITLLIVGSILAVVIVAGLVALRSLQPLVRRLLPSRVHHLYQKFEHGIVRSLRPRTIPALLLYTGVIWLLEGLRLYFVASALGLRLPLSVTLFIALASSLLTTIPFTPAGLGFVESAVVTVLLWFNTDAPTAFSVSLLDRVISYWSIVVLGLVVYLISSNRRAFGALGSRLGPPRAYRQ